MVKQIFLFISLLIIQNGLGQSKNVIPLSQRDLINGIYIPKDLKDSFSQINIIWSDSIKTKVKAMKESDFVNNNHFGFGMWMRNNWGLWKGSRLFKYLNEKGLNHPDDMSSVILTSYHRHLNNRNLKVRNQIKGYKEYWKKANKESASKRFKAKTTNKNTYTDLKLALKNYDSIIDIELIGYEKIPKKLERFQNLQELTIEDSPKIDLENAINRISKITSIQKLRFFNNSKSKYPENLGSLKNINSLWISGDSITNLPKSIIELKVLNELIINECPKIEFYSLFETLSAMDNLKELDISENMIKKVPDNIGALKQLKELWLDDNTLTEVTKGIKSLPNLEYLRLFSNEIKSLDFTISDLPSLKNIDLCYNPFEVFPIELGELKNLERITMWHTEVNFIPKDISKLNNLKFLNLQNSELNEEQKLFLIESLPNAKVIVK
ncbi:MAG: leucine-rich repeat domain-containing protein [Flavobacteriaceae bacterium]|nr:leucine-rich repeat domain-containing protein [Flavobacteriaceae bacterium]